MCKARRRWAESEKCRDGGTPCAESPGRKLPATPARHLSDTGKSPETKLQQRTLAARYAENVEIMSRFQVPQAPAVHAVKASTEHTSPTQEREGPHRACGQSTKNTAEVREDQQNQYTTCHCRCERCARPQPERSSMRIDLKMRAHLHEENLPKAPEADALRVSTV